MKGKKAKFYRNGILVKIQTFKYPQQYGGMGIKSIWIGECLEMKYRIFEVVDSYVDSEKVSHWAILCLRCGSVSHNKNDVDTKYCSTCKIFHEDQ